MGSNYHNDTSEKNGAIHTTCEIIKIVMSAASEDQCGATFINCKAAVPLFITLEVKGHTQPPSKKNGPKQWTCVFIGSKTESNKSISKCFGNLAPKTWEIIIKNTMNPTIIAMQESTIYTVQGSLAKLL